MHTISYDFLFSKETAKHWEKIGAFRRAGISVPLFSIYSRNSIGIGDLYDIKLLIDWCELTGNTILQLLPLNDTGFNFRPYDAESSFALDFLYLSMQHLIGLETNFDEDAEKLRKKYPMSKDRVNYELKHDKQKLLFFLFRKAQIKTMRFQLFKEQNMYWLEDYVQYKVIKDMHKNESWLAWDDKYKYRDSKMLETMEIEHAEQLEFYRWVQWQLFEQFKEVHYYAESKGVFLMGDMPFLTSRDSADVWAHPEYFKLDLYSGAPPDFYSASGQRWGMPPYNWDEIAKDNYLYFERKLSYQQNFYDLYRIDHLFGVFRVWTIPVTEPIEHVALNGKFDPSDENTWEFHGKTILDMMLKNTTMLPCAEDLGVAPKPASHVLEEMGIIGLDVQRWIKDRKTHPCCFKNKDEYRLLSCALVSAHDTSNAAALWEYELGSVSEGFFLKAAKDSGVDGFSVKDKIFDNKTPDHDRLWWKKEIDSVEKLCHIIGRTEQEIYPIVSIYKETYGEQEMMRKILNIKESEKISSAEVVRRMLEYTTQSSSIMSIQLLLDWILLEKWPEDITTFRINVPGTVSDTNWNLRIPLSLEEMLEMNINKTVLQINKEAQRH